MRTRLMKGNEAVVCGALLAGCQAYYGYPITPASEIAHASAKLFPAASRTFIQAESEVAAINMVFGAAASGVRCMTASSGPGISLKMEGVSFMACAEMPAVIADIMRVGPGLGNIYPDQGDYNQIVKGGGHGSYRCIVLAPNSVQEMCDMTMRAFDLADKWRMPVFVLSDAYVGQMMEALEVPEPITPPDPPGWALGADAATNKNLVTSIYLDADDMEAHVDMLHRKYDRIKEAEPECEQIETNDADIVMIGYGIVSRILENAVVEARSQGLKVGLFRPKTLWPFPGRELRTLSEKTKDLLVIELSDGQMIDDVRVNVQCPDRVEFMCRVGGNVPAIPDVIERLRGMASKSGN